MKSPDLSSLGPALTDIGVLTGILNGSKEFNPDWFKDPEKGLKSGFNWPNLKPLVEQLMGKATNPLETDGGPFHETWYPIKVTDDKGKAKDSAFYLVEKTVDKHAILGVGLHHKFEKEVKKKKVVIQPFAFIPVFKMPAEKDATPVFDFAKNGPLEIGVMLSADTAFTKEKYNGLLFIVSFDFSSPKPSFIFKLKKEDGKFVDAPTSTGKADIFNSTFSIDGVKEFLESKILEGTSNIKWAELAQALGWLKPNSNGFEVADIKMPGSIDEVKQYVQKLLLDAFNKFLGNDRVITLKEQKGKEDKDPSWSINLLMQDNRYGLNIKLKNVKVTSDPEVKLQAGTPTKDKTDWLAKAGGKAPEVQGINFFVLNGKKLEDISFDPHFEAINTGLDVSKPGKKPLFDIKGYTLKQAQLRGYFSSVQNKEWGVAAAMDSIALPLGSPKTSDSGVVQTLMASADKPKDSGNEKPAVNPEFSFITAYHKKFYLQLLDKDNKAQDIVTIPVEKDFGPVALKKAGIGWKNDKMQLLFRLDGGLNLNALQLELEKLTIGVPVKTPGDIEKYSLDLEGFDLSFKSGAVALAGGFLKDEATKPAQYNGAVTIQAAKWGISALGSFTTLEGKNPSLFIFGTLNAALGGPAFFFVTGLAAGFGYNRKLVMPAIEDVKNHPFIRAATEPKLFEGKDTDKILSTMSKVIPPELGAYWLAAGVKFTSFEILDSFALVTLQFGKRYEVGLLGLSTLELPKKTGAANAPKYVNAQMAVKATIDPQEGVLAVQAQLTDNSYVIAPECKISGGFAFYMWLAGPDSGDFVVTLGGYHKNFDVPKHYPEVPRLAFNWNVSGNITVNGEAYFALTPACIMAGGKLNLMYENGDLKAWFKAMADFLISWKPFRYDIAMGITVGVSYRVNLLLIHKTIAVELGVNVNMWGPDFGGEARVELWIISFTIGFGANKLPPKKVVKWEDFEKDFLPGDKKTLLLGAAATANNTDKNKIKINIGSGLKEKYVQNNVEYWVVDPGTFAFNAESPVPATQVSFVPGPAGAGDAPPLIACNPFGVKPLGSLTLKGDASVFTVGIKTYAGTANGTAYSMKGWNLGTRPANVPEALWGTVASKETPSAKSVKNITSGLTYAAPPLAATTGPAGFPSTLLNFAALAPRSIYLQQGELKEVTLDATKSLEKIKATLNDAAKGKKQRTEIHAALKSIGRELKNDDLAAMAAEAENIFQGSPMLAAAASKQNGKYAPAGKATLATYKIALKKAARGHNLISSVSVYNFGGHSTHGRVLRHGLLAKRMQTDATQNKHEGLQLSMQPGKLQIWKMGDTNANEMLSYKSSVPVRFIFFDENLEVISDETQKAAKNGGVSLPAHADQLVIAALDNDTPNHLKGWHETSQLPLVNVKYLLGKACMVRPQVPQSVGSKQFVHHTGLCKGSTVVSNNKVYDDENVATPGWIETRFLSSVKEIYVLARPDWPLSENKHTDDAFVVKAIYRNAEGSKQAVLLTPASSGIAGGEVWSGFRLPEEVLQSPYYSIWVQTRAGISLCGVAGSEQVLNGWNEAMSAELAGAFPALNSRNMKENITMKLNNATTV